jgi:DNA-binding MarR family transcriptional regulator
MTTAPPPSAPCVCARLRRASRALTRVYDEALEPVGLTVTQFSLLRNVERLGEPTVTELADITGHERSGLWRTLQPLAREGVLVLAAGNDQRTRRVRLTDAGRDVLKAGLPAWTAAQARVEAVLGEERRADLINLLQELETLGA